LKTIENPVQAVLSPLWFFTSLWH